MPARTNHEDALSAHQLITIESIERDKTIDLIEKSIAIAKVKGRSSAFVSNALVSKEVKRSLFSGFPKVKFTVRIHRNSCILVSWIDGPSVRKTEAAVGAFALEDDNNGVVVDDVARRTKTFTRDGVEIRHMVLSFRREVSDETQSAAIAYALKHFSEDSIRESQYDVRNVICAWDHALGRCLYFSPKQLKRLHRAGIPL